MSRRSRRKLKKRTLRRDKRGWGIKRAFQKSRTAWPPAEVESSGDRQKD